MSRAPLGISGTVLLLLLADSLQKKPASPPLSAGPQTLALGLFLFGPVLGFGKRSEGTGVPSPPAQAGAPSRPAADSPPCRSAPRYTRWEPGVGGGEARQFVVALHFLLQNSVFTTIGLACPRSSGLRSGLCCFIAVSSGSFLFAPAGRLLFHIFPPLPHAVPARQPATCSKASVLLLSPAPPQPPRSARPAKPSLGASGARCSGPAPVFGRSALRDKRVGTWTTASPSITALSHSHAVYFCDSFSFRFSCLRCWSRRVAIWIPASTASRGLVSTSSLLLRVILTSLPPAAPVVGLAMARGTQLSFFALPFLPSSGLADHKEHTGPSRLCATAAVTAKSRLTLRW